MINNILVLTPEYPADDLEKEFTPVVHFFTKEWVRLGYRVVVFNVPANFPKLLYFFAKPFRRKLESFFGINIRMYPLSKKYFCLDGVEVRRFPLKKVKPHGRMAKKEIHRCVNAIIDYCEANRFEPDVMIAHWTNPAIDLLFELKKIFHIPVAVTMHDSGYDFSRIYKDNLDEIFTMVDLWGFRNYTIKRQFEKAYGECKKKYMCFSGVPEDFIKATSKKNLSNINSFLFVGLLMKRKHPLELLKAINESNINDFTLSFIGEGDENNSINDYIKENPVLSDKVKLLGRISRSEVAKIMLESQVFCMISEEEAFGLVYIEAMAAGCITIASKNEGVDGIIVDGINGFLCEAGNMKELTAIINRIIEMEPAELHKISQNALITASKMTDKKVAETYIHDIEKQIETSDEC